MSTHLSSVKKHWRIALCGTVIFCGGIGVGLFVNSVIQKPVTVVPIRDPSSGYSLVNPLLYTEVSESLSFPKYSALNAAYAQYTDSAEAAQKATYIAVYYQDLTSGNWVGINQTEKFDPASMLKVATLIAILRASETSPGLLEDRISIPSSVVIPNGAEQTYYPPTTPIHNGNTYTVQQLVDSLIIQSDDGADAVLTSFLGNDALSTVFSDLNIPLPGTSTGVSAQQYSHLFRVLYNATYLTSADSQTALQLLTQTTFTPGLVAGVPPGTVVAHKFGESLFPPISDKTTWPQATSTANDIPGLSDCGIIYYPSHPYFLCVMTQGTDFNTLASVISDISSLTWQQVSALYPNNS